jgi:hypothetical protein
MFVEAVVAVVSVEGMWLMGTGVYAYCGNACSH